MIKILTTKGYMTTSEMTTAKRVAINEVVAGESAVVLASADREYIVTREGSRIFMYSVQDMFDKGNISLIEKYRGCCFAAHSAEERKAREAASRTTTTPKTASPKADSNLLEEIFNQFFGDFASSKKK